MKETPIVTIICLMLLLGLTVGCQPSQVENRENNLPPRTPAVLLPGGGTATGQGETAIATPVPTATSTAEATSSSTPPATKISLAEVHIVSEPVGALASITSDDLSEQTPITWAMLPGTYTVTLALDGYEDWMTLITVTAGSQITLTATLRQHYTVIPIQEGILAASELRWSENGQSLIYALADEHWPAHVQWSPFYQNWWLYDVATGVTQSLLPPQTRVTNAVRESLGICPFPLPETLLYPCSSNLEESPTSERIVFESAKLDSEIHTWMASIDGSDVVPLNKLPDTPNDVIWSSDGQWLLIGQYVGIDNSNLYYLVSSDDTLAESLEAITNTSHWMVQGVTPQFSPNGQKLAFVGIETEGKHLTGEQLNQEEAYNLYVLDLTTLEHQLVSPRFGLFQWARDGSGLYILDGSTNTAGHYVDYILGGVRYADFYYINLTQETYPEQKLAGDIPLYLPYLGAWAYSPEAQAMAGRFDVNGPIFAILLLE